MDRRKLSALPENLCRGLPYCTSPSRHPTQIRRPFSGYDSTCGALLTYAENSLLLRAEGGFQRSPSSAHSSQPKRLKTIPVRILSLAVFCTSVQTKSASVRASVIGGMREQITSPASRRGAGRQSWCGSLLVLSPEGLPPFCREACLAPSIAGREPQISPFLIDTAAIRNRRNSRKTKDRGLV